MQLYVLVFFLSYCAFSQLPAAVTLRFAVAVKVVVFVL